MDTHTSTETYTIVPDLMPFVPVIQVSQLGTAGITMTVAGETYTLIKGKNRFADIVVDQEDVTLSFKGQGGAHDPIQEGIIVNV